MHEAGQAFSNVPAQYGPLLGTTSPETDLLAAGYGLHPSELHGLQDPWIAVLPFWLILPAKVPTHVAQLDSGPRLHVSGLGRLVLGDEALGSHVAAVLRQLNET